MKKQFVTYAKMFIVAVAIFAGVGYISAQTPPPCSSPSACNVAAPVNIGTTGQIKNGSFGVGGASSSFFVSFFKSYLMGETWVGHDGSIISAAGFAAPGTLKVYGGKNPSNSSYPGLDRYGILNGSSAKFGNVNNGNFLEIGFDDAHSTIDGKHSNSGDRGLLLNYYSGGDVTIGGGAGGASNLNVSGSANVTQSVNIGDNLTVNKFATVVGDLTVNENVFVDESVLIDQDLAVARSASIDDNLFIGDDLRVSSLAGVGTAYACLDPNGKLFRSTTACVTAPPPATGTDTFSTPGTSSWTVPAGVTSITVSIWGAGGGGASTSFYGPGADGTDGGNSEFKNGGTTVLFAGGGEKGISTSTFPGNGNSRGGDGGTAWGGTINNTGSDGGETCSTVVPAKTTGGVPSPSAPVTGKSVGGSGNCGSGGVGNNKGPGAGGGGGYSQGTFTVVPGGAYTLVIGSAGLGGNVLGSQDDGFPGGAGYATISY